jgi:hypothetical protein
LQRCAAACDKCFSGQRRGEGRRQASPASRKNEVTPAEFDNSLTQKHHLVYGNQIFDVPPPPIPVMLGYFTVFPDLTVQAMRYPDVYGMEELASAGEGTPKLAYLQ